MTKETFKAELTKLCASGLAAGVISLEQFNQHIQIGTQVGSLESVKRRRASNITRTASDWNQGMFQLMTDLVVNGESYARIELEILKRHGKRVTYKSVQTMVWKVRSGRVFDSAKYRKEPIRTFLLECQKRLSAIEIQ